VAIEDALELPVRRALERGAVGVAALSPMGDPLIVMGELDRAEVRALAAAVSHRRSADFLERLFDGELVTASVDEREICLCVSARCLFVVVVLGVDRDRALAATEMLRAEIDIVVRAARSSGNWPPPGSGWSGSGSPPAEAFVFPPGERGRRGGKN
jgi:hypothetical protein